MPPGPNRDGILRWMEAYADMLASGMFEVGPSSCPVGTWWEGAW